MDPRDYPEKIKQRRGPGGPNGKRRTKPNANDKGKQAYLADRAGYVVEQILQAKKYREIAEELGISISGVHADFERAMLAKKAKNVDELRDLYSARYEGIIAAHYGPALAGDHRSGELVLKATAAAARLNGAEAPQKHELSGPAGQPIAIEGAREQVFARLARIAAQRGAGEEAPEPQRH